MTVNPAAEPNRSRDVARRRELTRPHMSHPGALIQQAMVRMTAEERTEVIAILGRIPDPRKGATDDDVA